MQISSKPSHCLAGMSRVVVHWKQGAFINHVLAFPNGTVRRQGSCDCPNVHMCLNGSYTFIGPPSVPTKNSVGAKKPAAKTGASLKTAPVSAPQERRQSIANRDCEAQTRICPSQEKRKAISHKETLCDSSSVAVVKPSNLGQFDHLAKIRYLNLSRFRGVLGERQVGARALVIVEV